MEVERQMLMMRAWERLEYAVIGRRLGDRSAGTVRMVHARACKRLFRELGDEPS